MWNLMKCTIIQEEEERSTIRKKGEKEEDSVHSDPLYSTYTALCLNALMSPRQQKKMTLQFTTYLKNLKEDQ